MVKLLALLGGCGLALIAACWQTPWPRMPAGTPTDVLAAACANRHELSACATLKPAVAGLLLQAPQPLLKRLPPRDRARVLAALAGLIILGFALVLLAWWGGRFTRRYLRRPWPGSRRRDSDKISEFDWARKPMYPTEDGEQHAEGDPRE